MICPKCKHSESQVVDSRDATEGVRRRRECLKCKHRFTTYERAEVPSIVVIKKSGNRERFNPEKIRRGLTISCKNRPVSSLQIDEMVEEVEHRLYFLGKDEVTSQEIGDIVRELLQKTDEIAYIRFVSVYQAFTKIEQFTKTIDTLS
jgi:transcriptional repressor NrdR